MQWKIRINFYVIILIAVKKMKNIFKLTSSKEEN